MSRRLTLSRDARGAVVMEFGLLILPLSVVLMGVLDMGFGMYLRSTLQGAVNDVSRAAVVESPVFTGTGTLQQRIETAVERRLGGLVGASHLDLQIESFDEYSRVNAPEKIVRDANSNGEIDTGDCWIDLEENGEYDAQPSRAGRGGADDIAIYTATLSMPRLLPMATLIGMTANYEIEVRSAVRNQPFENQTPPPTECEE